MPKTYLLISALALAATACDEGDARGNGAPNPTPVGTDTGDPGDTGNPTTGTPPGDSDGAPGGDTEAEDESTSANFIAEVDAGAMVECDVWTQDCPGAGEKCMPWANDGGITWNATRCVPVMDGGGQAGDSCTAEGGLTGIDDCDASSMCWNVDGETGQGVCVAFCTGTPEAPQCADSATECSISLDGVLILCLPSCDPLLQDCPEGEACYQGVEGGFQCYPDYSGENGNYGDACKYTNVCNEGLFCGAASLVPSCGSALCCTEFCDVTEDNASSQCQGEADGQQCLPWYAEGEAPPGLEAVGYCGVPT